MLETIIQTINIAELPDDIEQLLLQDRVKKNNEASKKYRRKKGEYLAELEKELCKLKKKNDELKMKELGLEHIVEEMRRRLLLMLTSSTTDDGETLELWHQKPPETVRPACQTTAEKTTSNCPVHQCDCLFSWIMLIVMIIIVDTFFM